MEHSVSLPASFILTLSACKYTPLSQKNLANKSNRILEVHNKTIIPIAGCLITLTGYWIWNIVISAVYSYTNKTRPLYHIKDGFIYHHGRDITWWLILLLTILSLLVYELGVQSLRKTFFPTDTDIFQVLQKDPAIRKRFEEMLKREEEAWNIPEEEKEQDVSIEDILGAKAKEEVDIQLQQVEASKKPRGRGLLARRKKSVDESNTIEMSQR